MSGAKRKHVTLSIAEKLNVLERLDKGESVQKIASEIGVGITTIKDWRKNRKQIESHAMLVKDERGLKCRKTLKKPKCEVLDNALWVWFEQERRKGTPLSGPIIKEKAHIMFAKIGGDSENDTFTASEGWLHRWKKRHGIREVIISGEKISADVTASNDFIPKFENLVEEHGLKPDQVYNIDESGLNFKMLPTRTLAAQNEAVEGTKLAKERITIALCSNANGSHKMPLFVIGKSKKPRAFKNINMASLPVFYRNQKAAWMDSALFKEWFFDQFVPAVIQQLKAKKLPLRAILVLDNASSHPAENELKKGQIKTVFLPANVTSLIQPMDQGVIEWLKRRYRRKFIGSILEKTEEGSSLLDAIKSINIKDVIYTVAEAWEELPLPTIEKSWRKLWPKMKKNDESVGEENAATAQDENQDVDTPAILRDLRLMQPGIEAIDVADWIQTTDADCATEEELTDDQIIETINAEHEQRQEDGDEDEDCSEPTTRVSHSDAKKAFDLALQYIEEHSMSTPMDILWVRKWRNAAAKARLSSAKQKNITEFFQPEQN